MYDITKPVVLNVTRANNQTFVFGKQGDRNTRFLNCTLVDAYNKPVFVQQHNVATINAKRGEEARAFLCEILCDGVIKAPLTAWMLQSEGTLLCEIAIFNADEQRLATACFTLNVQESVYLGEDITTDENYSPLVSLLAEVSTAKEAEAARVLAEAIRVQAETERVTVFADFTGHIDQTLVAIEQSKDAAVNASLTATEKAASAGVSATQAQTAKNAAEQYKEEAEAAAANAKDSENNAKQSELNAKESENSSRSSETITTQAMADLLSMLGSDVATLTNGKLTPSQIPHIAITDTFVAATEAAMLALDCQTGDICIRTDENKTYILQGTIPSDITHWQQLKNPTNYADEAGHAQTAANAENSDKVNGKRIIGMTQSQYESAVLSDDTFYFVTPDEV